MAEWTLTSVDYTALIRGGKLDNHRLRLSAHRERKNQYSVTISIREPGGGRPIVSANYLRDVSIHRVFKTMDKALTEAFKALYKSFDGGGRARLVDLEQNGAYWEYFDASGKVDWDYMQKHESERPEGYEFTPPAGMWDTVKGIEHESGKAVKASFTDAQGSLKMSGARAGQDATLVANDEWRNFTKVNGLKPSSNEE